MSATSYTVKDPIIRQFAINFPVLEQDLALFVNGIKLSEQEYTFSQATNNVTIHTDLNPGDLVSIRVIKAK